jgi:proteasome lid subunit RPN8/RPN11
MIVLILPLEIRQTIKAALLKAGTREVGGVLMAEHLGPNRFLVKELTVHRRGAFASFVRFVEEALGRLKSFFDQSQHEYTRYNYIGEWHSHPSFEPIPSGKDDASMIEIVQDPIVGANFAVLLVVKLARGDLVATLHTYLPDGTKHQSVVEYQNGSKQESVTHPD